MHYVLPGHSLLINYKSFLRPHLDYGDIIYEQWNKQAFSNKIEIVQYNIALANTGAIQYTSRTKLYQELGLELLKTYRWFRQLSYFCRIKKLWSPRIYIYIYIYMGGLHQSCMTVYDCRIFYNVDVIML